CVHGGRRAPPAASVSAGAGGAARPVRAARRALLLPAAVVRRLDGHLDVVRVALLQAGGGDLHQPALLPQLVAGPHLAVPHRLAQPADQLVGDGLQRTAVGDLALDTLRDELLLGGDLGLGVAVLGERAAAHRAERAHAAVALVLLAVDEDQLAGALLDAGQQA